MGTLIEAAAHQWTLSGQSQSQGGTMAPTQVTINVNPNQDDASPSVTFMKLIC